MRNARGCGLQGSHPRSFFGLSKGPIQGMENNMILQVPKRIPTHVHHQTSPNTEWTINHFQGKYPSVTTTDEGGAEMKGRTVYVNANTVRVQFSTPLTGWAYLN